jgi:hypothetical protein
VALGGCANVFALTGRGRGERRDEEDEGDHGGEDGDEVTLGASQHGWTSWVRSAPAGMAGEGGPLARKCALGWTPWSPRLTTGAFAYLEELRGASGRWGSPGMWTVERADGAGAARLEGGSEGVWRLGAKRVAPVPGHQFRHLFRATKRGGAYSGSGEWVARIPDDKPTIGSGERSLPIANSRGGTTFHAAAGP